MHSRLSGDPNNQLDMDMEVTNALTKKIARGIFGVFVAVCYFHGGLVCAGESPETAMAACNSAAGSRKGEDRKAFMVSCLNQRRPASESLQSGRKASQCGLAETEQLMRSCRAEELTSVEADLNTVYKLLRSQLQKIGETGIEKDLVIAQRDWVRFRQSHCEFESVYEGLVVPLPRRNLACA